MMGERRHTHSATLPGEQPSSYKPEESAYLESTIGVPQQSNNNNNNHNDKVGKTETMRIIEKFYTLLVVAVALIFASELARAFILTFYCTGCYNWPKLGVL